MLSGEIIEEDTFTEMAGQRNLYAFIGGSCNGRDVYFTKTYNQGGKANHSIDYSGNVDDSFTLIEGTWSIFYTPEQMEMYNIESTFSGRFIMNRGGKGGITQAIERKEKLLETIGTLPGGKRFDNKE